jgi:hypothetical protein
MIREAGKIKQTEGELKDPMDITDKFLTLDSIEFKHFLYGLEQNGINNLLIKIKWGQDMTPYTMDRLKTFIEDARGDGERKAIVVSSINERKYGILSQLAAANAFASGVTWEQE